MKAIKKYSILILMISLFGCGGDNPEDPEKRRPEITSSASVTAIEDSTFSYTATFTDPDILDTIITFENYPDWLSPTDNQIEGLTPWDAVG